MLNMPSVLPKSPQLQNEAQRQRKWQMGSFFLLLIVVDWYLYFRDPGHFFQADGIFILYHRPDSLAEFLRALVTLDSSGWYRPLSHHAVGFILFPFLDLEPVGYHILVYVLFIANTVGVYLLSLGLFRRQLPAALAAFFFNVHTMNAFTTYDIGFLPELLYTLFYVFAVIGYVRFVRLGSRTAYCLSIACFVLSLLSKEAAITLPGILILTHLLLTPAPGSLWGRVRQTFRPIAIYAAIAVVYVGFVIGYLHVQNIDLTKIFRQPETVSAGSYHFVLDRTVPLNVDLAFSWAFNMPRGWNNSFRSIPNTMVIFLRLFRAIVLGLAVFLLFRSQRKILLFAIAWFCLTVMPALPLVNHFLPYYLFLPVVGWSLLIGTIFGWANDRVGRMHWSISAGMIAVLFGGLVLACNASIQSHVQNHPLLGGSAKLAVNSLADLRELYPTLPAKPTIYFADSEEPLAWEHAWGALIKMAYKREDVRVLYSSWGDLLSVPSDSVVRSGVIVLRHRGGNLIDETAAFFKDPSPYAPTKVSNSQSLSVSKARVVVGDTFSIVITGVKGVVAIAYRLNDDLPDTFRAYLGPNSSSQFNVSADTPKGVYRFVGFSLEGQREWIRADATISVE